MALDQQAGQHITDTQVMIVAGWEERRKEGKKRGKEGKEEQGGEGWILKHCSRLKLK